MKLKHLFTLLAAFAIAVPAFAADDDTPLAKEMEKISKALKFINRSIGDASKNDECLTKVAEAKAANAAGLKYEPAKTKDVPAAEKAKFLAGYKSSMEEVGKNLDALKTAIAAGKTDDAKALLEKLNGEKKEGHKKYKADD
ncbi:MAG: cytochrome b562 [Chthoniobacteraceae bacterium]